MQLKDLRDFREQGEIINGNGENDVKDWLNKVLQVHYLPHPKVPA